MPHPLGYLLHPRSANPQEQSCLGHMAVARSNDKPQCVLSATQGARRMLCCLSNIRFTLD